MAHEFETGFFRQTPAWHGLGNVIGDAPSIEEGIIQAGLDWEVETRDMWTTTERFGNTPVPERKAVVRMSDDSILGTVGPDWTPLQNVKAFQFFEPLMTSGAIELEAAGSLKKGRVVWVLGKFKDEGEVVDGDKVRSYLLLSNAHDGSRAVTVQLTDIRVVCWNTLSMAHSLGDKGAEQSLRVRHMPNVVLGLDAVQRIIDCRSRQFQLSLNKYRKLASQKLPIEGLAKYVKEVLRLEDVQPKAGKKAREPRVIPVIEELFLHGIGNEIPEIRGTYWAAFNAITEWQDYYRGKEENRLFYSWFGPHDIKARALDVALEHCGGLEQ